MRLMQDISPTKLTLPYARPIRCGPEYAWELDGGGGGVIYCYKTHFLWSHFAVPNRTGTTYSFHGENIVYVYGADDALKRVLAHFKCDTCHTEGHTPYGHYAANKRMFSEPAETDFVCDNCWETYHASKVLEGYKFHPIHGDPIHFFDVVGVGLTSKFAQKLSLTKFRRRLR